MHNSLKGKTALVTGAARGIGLATACAFADAGANIVASDISVIDELSESLARRTDNYLALYCDVTRTKDVVDMVRQGRHRFAAIDIVVNNAGIVLEKSVTECSDEAIERIIDVNLKGVFRVGREVIATMLEDNRPGRIINIASELGLLGRENFSIYCATKGAIISLTRSWARELAPEILVNAVAPGPVDTDMVGLENMSPEWVEKELNTPLGRIGKPEEIADAILFLSGSTSTFVTGQTFGVNGGVAMY